jgi:tetratricopeptide (TPR) repeat protein
MKNIVLTLFIIYNLSSYSQVNCYIYPENSGERKACELCDKAIEYPQGSRESQLIFDSAISIGPKFAWAYYEKSVPYFKRGFLLEGLQILNKAIELEPLEYLCYRASWEWQYRNYELCIQDLETYYAMPKAYFQLTPGGEKDMRIILGLAYAKIGKYAKGIQTIVDCLNSYESEDDIGLTDYHELGVLYVFNKQYNKAIEALKKQFEINKNLPDTYYYLGLAYKGKHDLVEANIQFDKALLKFEDYNRYYSNVPGFRVYLSDLQKEIAN